MTFTDAQLRLLAASDRAMSSRGRALRSSRIGRPPGGLGSLTDEQVHQLHAQGLTRAEIAVVAGVLPDAVTRWRQKRGMSRRKRGQP